MKIKHLNLNIWMGKLLPEALKFIKKENPDIISLQEVLNNPDHKAPEALRLLSVLTEKLAYPHYIFNANFLNERQHLPVPTPDGNAIFSKFPITNSTATFIYGHYGPVNDESILEEQPRSLLHATINVEGKALNVFNYHGIWGRHGEDTEKRLQSVRQILETIGESSKVILSGDFNLNERIFGTKLNYEPNLNFWNNTQSVKILESKLINVFKNERITSFNVKRKPQNTGYAYSVVDMVFISPDIKVISLLQPEADISDHLPQVCEFEI